MFKRIKSFIQWEASSGVILLLMMLCALFWANSPGRACYNALFSNTSIGHQPLSFWINDGLMTLFFFMVGLEIKREVYVGELNTWKKRFLPGAAALGGMLVPALIYVAINHADPQALLGWGIPTATDIAFALGILNLLGKRIPNSLKVFLTALAILDDLGAIVLITFFYVKSLAINYLCYGLATIGGLWFLNRRRCLYLSFYIIFASLLWWFFYKAGIHPTLTGVITAFAIPSQDAKGRPWLKNVELKLYPWISFGVLPLFALANSGVTFKHFNKTDWTHPMVFSIAAALFVGKQLGVLSAIWIMVKLKLAKLPKQATWKMTYGIALLCGIGFTMSLFMNDLAFSEADPKLIELAKLGVFVGSLLAGLSGYGYLRWLSRTFSGNR